MDNISNNTLRSQLLENNIYSKREKNTPIKNKMNRSTQTSNADFVTKKLSQVDINYLLANYVDSFPYG